MSLILPLRSSDLNVVRKFQFQSFTIQVIVYSLAVIFLPAAVTFGEEDAVYEFSPFVVSADSEIGYMATQTLAGTRLRSDLSDVGASIEVLTEEFLSDIAASDMYDALDFAGSVSTWHQSGGISEIENQVWFSTPYMARGFFSSMVLLDFFQRVQIPIDRYNTEQLTIARGPNSVLYGIGSPGGVVSAARLKPMFGSDGGRLQLRGNSEGSFRAAIDYNLEIIPRKLAVRVDLLHDDRKEFLKPAGRERNAIYGAATWRPGRYTSLTLTAEQGSENSIFRLNNATYDAVTPWHNAGSPVVEQAGDAIDNSIGTGLDREARQIVIVAGQPQIPVMDWFQMGRSERWEIEGHPDVPAVRRTGFTEKTAPFDILNVQLIGEGRERRMNWQDYTLTLEQRLAPGLQMQIAYNHARTNHQTLNSIPGWHLHVDPNKQLPNGEPNPNFLAPYIEFDRNDFIGSRTLADTVRGTLSYELDLNDRRIMGAALGRYNFMGMLENRREDNRFALFRRVNMEPNLPGFPAANIIAPVNRIRTRVYLETDITPDGVQAMPYYVPSWELIDEPGITSGWVRASAPRNLRESQQTFITAVQAFYWQSKEGFDRIILTGGYRHDSFTSQDHVFNTTSGNFYEGENFRGSPWEAALRGDAFWDANNNYGSPGTKTRSSNPTHTFSAVYKPVRDLSLVYNRSDVLIAISSLNTDIYGLPLTGTTGKTEDIGFRLSGFDGRLVGSFTYFETYAENQTEANQRNDFSGIIDDIWDVVDPSRGALPERFVTLRDDRSKGFEFSLVANPQRNWRIRLSISKMDTTILSRLRRTDEYVAEFSPIWQSNSDLPLDPSISSPDYMTVGDALTLLNRRIADIHALEGAVPNALRPWKVVFNTNYNFTRGPLRKLGVGGGVIWEDRDIIGYAYDENLILDTSRPFYGDDNLEFMGWISYNTKMFGHNLRLQLNVRNLLNERGTFPRDAIDDLTGNANFTRQQVRAPRTFTLTATLDW